VQAEVDRPEEVANRVLGRPVVPARSLDEEHLLLRVHRFSPRLPPEMCDNPLL
jgi:hypothetical protein